ncbi:MAG: DUF4157 domain-containing protein [Paludibacteraceae bacterium]|nr:DUF4157 domain-containing protein [Paludibacteraceae bacterium]
MFVNVSSRDAGNSHHSSKKSDNNSVAYPSRTVVHPKLEMTEPGDADEREADAAAHDVMSGKVFRKFSGGGAGGGMAVSSQMESQLNQLQGGGQAMPDGLRGMMERGFDRDFSQVRLHTDGEAAGLSSSIHAKAFTHGNDIYFNQGQYAPETSEGQRLVAHELAHVAQGGGKVGREDDPLQRDLHEYFDDFIHALTPGLANAPSSVEFQVNPNNYQSQELENSDGKKKEMKMIDCDVYAYETIAFMENRIGNPRHDSRRENGIRNKVGGIYQSRINPQFRWELRSRNNRRSNRISDYMIVYDGVEIGDLSEIARGVGIEDEITSKEDAGKLYNAVQVYVENVYQNSEEYKRKIDSMRSATINISGRHYYPIVFEDHMAMLFESGNSWYMANNGEVYKFRRGNEGELNNSDVITVDRNGVPRNIDNVIKKINELHGNEFTYYFFRKKRYEIENE